MVDLYSKLEGQNFEIVAVNLRESPDRVASFADQMGMSFPVLLDTSGQVGDAYFVRGIPTSIFIDENGVIQNVHEGTLTNAMLRDYVQALMDS